MGDRSGEAVRFAAGTSCYHIPMLPLPEKQNRFVITPINFRFDV